MKTLGIESTAHTFGVGVVDERGRILFDERVVLRPPEGMGILPREAADLFSREGWKPLLKAVNMGVDGVAFSIGPGLGPSLRTGAVAARYIASSLNVPLIGVNHSLSHIEIGKLLTGAEDPVVVYTSGANTQIIAHEGGKYRIFGETLDMGIGNMLDTFARRLGLSMPGPPKLLELAQHAKQYIPLPYTVKGSDLTFSGLLTAAERALEKYPKEDVAFSLLETAFAMVVEVAERALAHTEKDEVLLVGGVAASPRFQEMMKTMAEERGAKVHIVPQKYAVDNGVMIAWTGYLYLSHGYKTPINTPINPYFRIDQAETPWLDAGGGI